MPLIFVDVEASGPVPSMGRMTEFACVPFDPSYTIYHTFSVVVLPSDVRTTFKDWLTQFNGKHLTMVSDNPAFDFMWIADWCWRVADYNTYISADAAKRAVVSALCNSDHQTRPVE